MPGTVFTPLAAKGRRRPRQRTGGHGAVQRVARSELDLRQRLPREVALVDAVPRAVLQRALLPLLRVDALADCRVDHDQLAGDPPRLLQEAIRSSARR